MVAKMVPALLLVITIGCSPDPGGPAGDGSTATAAPVQASPVKGGGSTEAAGSPDSVVLPSPELSVALPADEPLEASSEVAETGTGPPVGVGDAIYLAWEMMSFGTGEIVESTEAFGGPVQIVVGAKSVPAALEEALIGQTVGTRLHVEFPAGMADLPPYLDDTVAYVLTVQIVQLADDGSVDGQAAQTSPDPDRPTTTSPDGSVGLLVSADGPLMASPDPERPPPARNSFEVITAGDGRVVVEGDTVRVSYVTVSWTTGDVVGSTDDDAGGPQTIVLGDLSLPRLMESAIFEQRVGSRIQIVFAPDLPDLPQGLSPDDAYIVALDILEAS